METKFVFGHSVRVSISFKIRTLEKFIYEYSLAVSSLHEKTKYSQKHIVQVQKRMITTSGREMRRHN